MKKDKPLSKTANDCPFCGKDESEHAAPEFNCPVANPAMPKQSVELAEIRLKRTVNAAYHALLEMSAWLGIPEKKRAAQIEELMSNVKFCAENNMPEDHESLKANK